MRKKEAPLKPDSEASKTQISALMVKTPRKQDPQSITKKGKQTPIKNLDGSLQILSMSDKEELFLLEIKQLKRENNFLKKKISEMTTQASDRYGSRRMINKQKRSVSPVALEVFPLSINVVFQEINNTLNTIVKLFRLEFTEKEISDYNKLSNSQVKEACPIKKHLLFKKYYLKQKLERIMLEAEQNRFPSLVELFSQYYKEKEEYDQKVINTIDDMTLKVHQLNQMILKKAQEKKKIKGTFSTIKKEEQQTLPIQIAKSPAHPKNFIAQNKMMANSPLTNRNGKKPNRFPMSPAQKIRQSDI